MGSLLNQITAPVGLRLFPNGPYADRGLGDQALGIGQQLGGAGSNFLRQGGSLPGLSDLGVAGAIPSILQQLANIEGVQNPLASGTSGGSAPQQSADPSGLQGSYLSEFNALKGNAERARQNALGQLRAHLAARGINDSTAAQAHEDYLNRTFDNALSNHMSTLLGTQRQGQEGTLGNFANLLTGLSGQQQQRQGQLVGMGSNLLGTQLGATQHGAANAEQMSNNAFGQLGGLLGTLAGGGFGGGTPWRVGQSTPRDLSGIAIPANYSPQTPTQSSLGNIGHSVLNMWG